MPFAYRILLTLHARRLRRHTADITWLHWLAAALLLALPLLVALKAMLEPAYALAAAGGVAIALWQLHRRRRDARLLAHLIDDPRQIYRREYAALVLPPAAFWLFTANWPAALLVVALSQVVAYSRPGTAGRHGGALFWGRIVPSYFFEWIAGLRRFGWALAVLYVAAWIAAPLLPFLTLFLLWLQVAMWSVFYLEGEPRAVLEAEALPADAFLARKLGRHLGLHLALTAPPLLLYTALHPAHGWFVVAVLILNLAQHFVFIGEKYATYQPGARLSGSLMQALASLGVLVPFFAPVTLMLAVRNLVLARRHLKQLLPDAADN